jgi:hypothetical protein
MNILAERGKRFLFFGVVVSSFSLFAHVDAALSENISKPEFFQDRGLGSLAVVRGARTRSQADYYRSYFVLGERRCNFLDDRRSYLVINHRSEKHIGDRAYFSIRIAHFHNFRDRDSAPTQTELHLYRNDSAWYDASNAQVRDYRRVPDEFEIDLSQLLEMHGNSVDQEQGREDAATAIGDFHAFLETDSYHAERGSRRIDTWTDRLYIGGRSVRRRVANASRFSVRNFGFEVFGGRSSTSPVVFDLEPHGAEGAIIIVSSSLKDVPTRTYEIGFKRSVCSG